MPVQVWGRNLAVGLVTVMALSLGSPVVVLGDSAAVDAHALGAGAPTDEAAARAGSPAPRHPSVQHRQEHGPGFSVAKAIIDEGGPPSYGRANADSRYYEYISKAVIGYNTRTNKVSLEVQVTITTGDPDDYGAGQYVNAWIDFDHNGRYDPGELVMSQLQFENSVNYKGTLVFSQEFDMPHQADIQAFAPLFSPMQGESGKFSVTVDPSGLSTWLRVAHGYGVDPGPTGSWRWGSVYEHPFHFANPLGREEDAKVTVQVFDPRDGDELADESFDVTTGVTHPPVAVWDGLTNPWFDLEMPYPNAAYPVKITAEFGGFFNKKRVTKRTTLNLYDSPNCQVQVRTRWTKFRGQTLALTRKSGYTEWASHTPEDPNVITVYGFKSDGSPISVTATGVDLLAGEIAERSLGRVMKTQAITRLLGEAAAGLVTDAAGSILAQVIMGHVNDGIRRADSILANHNVVSEAERKEWLPAVRDRGNLFYYDNLVDNVVLDTERTLVGTRILNHPRFPEPFTDINRGWEIAHATTVPPALGEFSFINLDSIGTQTLPKYYEPSARLDFINDPHGVNTRLAALADLKPATINLDAYKAHVLEKYKAEMMRSRTYGAGDGCGVDEPEMELCYSWSGGADIECNERRGRSAAEAGSISARSVSVASAPAFTAHGVDDNGDGLNEWLEMTVPMAVETPGQYFVTVWLSNGDRTATVAPAHAGPLALEAGQQSVTVRFRGTDVRRSGIDGPYAVDLLAVDEPAAHLLHQPVTELTGPFRAVEFTPDKIAFHGVVTEETVDGSGGIQALRLQVPVAVREAGDYLLSGSLTDSDGVYIASTAHPVRLETGSHTIALSFPGATLHHIGKNGPYTVHLTLLYPGAARLTQTHTTRSYQAAAFAPAAGRLNGVTGQGPVDGNGDGYYEQLGVSAGLSVRQGGAYRLYGTLYDPAGRVVASGETGADIAQPGDTSLSIYFPGDRIAEASKTDLRVEFSLFREEGERSFGLGGTGRVALAPIQPDRFGRPHYASLTGAYADQGIDLNGDGRFDALQISVGVNAAVTGPYQLSGRLLGADGQEIHLDRRPVSLHAGEQTLHLQFPGNAIGAGRTDGPYQLADVALYYTGLDTWPMAAHTRTAYTTGPYSYRDFDRGAAYLTGAAGADHGVDTDGDGLFDYLETDLQVQVTKGGYYRMDAGLYSSGGLQIDWVRTADQWLDPGARMVTLRYSGGKIRGFGDASPYRVKSVRLFDGSDLIDSVENAYTTGTYRAEQFDPLPADLAVGPGSLAVQQVQESPQRVKLKVAIRNIGGTPAHNVLVRMTADGTPFEWRLPAVTGAEPGVVEAEWQPGSGTRQVRVQVDPTNEVAETDEGNNSLVRALSFPMAFPSAPGTVAVSLSGPDAVVSWAPPAGDVSVTGYHVYRSSESEGPYARVSANPVSGTTFSDSTAGGRSYWYRVTSLVGSDPARESVYSAPARAPEACTVEPAFAWKTPLGSAEPYPLRQGDTLPVRFTWRNCAGLVRDEAAMVMIWDEANEDLPVSASVLGADLVFDEAAGEYRIQFSPGRYGLAPATALRVEVYLENRLVSTSHITVMP